MGWLRTFSLVVRSNMTALCERFENPERVLHQLVLDMEEELERVRGHAAGVIADEIQLGQQVAAAGEEATRWHERAALALARGDEANARAALEQKVLAQERTETLAVEHRRQQH